MQVYLDTSALVKLVVREKESSALRRYLQASPHDGPSAEAHRSTSSPTPVACSAGSTWSR